MQIGVAYAEPTQQIWLRIEVPESCTVQIAIERSGLLEMFPNIDLSVQKVGIFGKLSNLDAPLHSGDRVEIYRNIIADPKTVPRRRVGEQDEE